jgi:Tol biopolymer transport system component
MIPRTKHRSRAAYAGGAALLAALVMTGTVGVASASSRPIIAPVGPNGSSPGAVEASSSPGATVEPGANGRIAFVSDRYAGTPNIFTVDPTNPTVVSRLTGCNHTNCPGGAISPAWSPDGRLIAFVRDADGEGSGPIYTMFAGGGTQAQVGSLVGESPTWSPDASLLAFASAAGGSNEDIYVASADGTGSPVDLTNDAASPDLQPAWSPDGKKIAYIANGTGGTTDVFVVKADGTGSPVDLTNSAAAEQHPAWSADGTQIAYDDGTGIWWIPIPMRASASPTQVVADGVMPSWSGDGKLIAFSTARTGNLEVFTTTIDGATQTQVTNDAGADILPVWQSIQVTIATSASVVFFRDPVTITAHLNLYQQTSNPNVSIYKTVFGGSTYLVATGPVDGNGDFARTIQIYDRTAFYATWDGDSSHPPSQSAQQTVQVQSVTTGALSGYYGSSGNYKLYHYTSQCVGSQHIGCPVYTVTVVPDGTGLPIDFTLQLLSGSTWQTIGQFSFPLGKGSTLAVKLTYSNNGVIGHSFRIMAAFKGDGGSLGSQTGWSYFKITT